MSGNLVMVVSGGIELALGHREMMGLMVAPLTIRPMKPRPRMWATSLASPS